MRTKDMYRIVLSLLIVGVLATAGWADVIDTLTLGATQDAWCEQNGSDAGDGTGDFLKFKSETDEWKAFVQFDVASALSNAGYSASQVSSGTLYVKVKKLYQIANKDSGFGVRYCESAWDEDDYDTSPTPAIPDRGDWLADHTWAQVSTSGWYTKNEWIEFDITAAVQAWADGTKTNYGVMLDAVQHDWWQREIHVYSKDCPGTDGPYLDIEIVPEPATLTLLASGGLGVLLRRKK